MPTLLVAPRPRLAAEILEDAENDDQGWESVMDPESFAAIVSSKWAEYATVYQEQIEAQLWSVPKQCPPTST